MRDKITRLGPAPTSRQLAKPSCGPVRVAATRQDTTLTCRSMERHQVVQNGTWRCSHTRARHSSIVHAKGTWRYSCTYMCIFCDDKYLDGHPCAWRVQRYPTCHLPLPLPPAVEQTPTPPQPHAVTDSPVHLDSPSSSLLQLRFCTSFFFFFSFSFLFICVSRVSTSDHLGISPDGG